MQLMGGLHGAGGRREVGGGSPAAVTFHMLRGPGGNWNKCGLKGAQKPRSWGFVCGRGAAAPPPCSGRGVGGHRAWPCLRGRVWVHGCEHGRLRGDAHRCANRTAVVRVGWAGMLRWGCSGGRGEKKKKLKNKNINKPCGEAGQGRNKEEEGGKEFGGGGGDGVGPPRPVPHLRSTCRASSRASRTRRGGRRVAASCVGCGRRRAGGHPARSAASSDAPWTGGSGTRPAAGSASASTGDGVPSRSGGPPPPNLAGGMAGERDGNLGPA